MDETRRPRARVVKKTSWFTRIRNFPEDYFTRIDNDIRALDWDRIQDGTSWPLAVGLNLLLGSVKLGYWLDDPLGNAPSVIKYDRSFYSSSSMSPGFAALLSALQFILIGISFGNAVWLFHSKKNYKLMHRDPEEPPRTSNAKLVEFQRQTKPHWSVRFPWSIIWPYIPSFIKGSRPEERSLQVWEMSLWDPSVLSRNLFCWFSPAQVLIMAAMNADNFHIFVPLSVVVAAQVHFVVAVYQTYVKDKQILFGEVCREYDNKFVHPRVFVRKYDKSISTETDNNEFILETYREDGSVRYQPAKKPAQYQISSLPRVSTSTSTSTSTSMPSNVLQRKQARVNFKAPSFSSTSTSTTTGEDSASEEEEGEDEEDADTVREYTAPSPQETEDGEDDEDEDGEDDEDSEEEEDDDDDDDDDV
ncbi:hypothetical protein BGZ83_010615 [Gryganskiella cystojenkinii]|nr:hypothetical protein BGZ83_010615 [Gryganskiella cystojenkinii]